MIAQELRDEGLTKEEIEEARISFKRGIDLLVKMYFDWEKKQLLEKYPEPKEENKEAGLEDTEEYNLSRAARIIGVTRQCLYYWIKKEWIVPRRDYRNYPVFTLLDIQMVMGWRKKLKK